MTEQISDVTVKDYLTNRRPWPHLFDVAPHMDPAAFQADADPDCTALKATVRSEGERGTDIRLLVDDGARHVDLARDLANGLLCDVYLTPDGAHVRYVRESDPVTSESWDAVSHDRATGEPAEWLVVRASALPADVPTWFVSTRGRLRSGTGLVSVPLPDGVAFATRATFRDIASLAPRLKAGASRVTTVAVTADMGRFEISRFDDAGALLGGVEFATLVAASLDVVHPDVLLALTWPSDTAACTALDVELMRLADALNRTVWVPEPAGSAFVLPGCGEFAAVDEVGGPSRWRVYASRLAIDWQPQYGTDLDGRLVPMGAVTAARFPGLRLVSVVPRQLEMLRPWYESLAPCEDLFAIDLAALGDGRLGVVIRDGRVLAVGARELRALLRKAGWSGEDLLVLAQPPAEHWHATIDHVRHLVELLAVDIWLPAPGSDVWANPDGTLAAEGPEGGWRVVGYRRAADVADEDTPLPAALARSPKPTAQSWLRPRTGAELASAHGLSVSGFDPDSAPTMVMKVIELAGAPAAPFLGAGAPHGVHWLPSTPEGNPRPIDLYIWTPSATDVVEGWGLPAADLFLLASQDALRLAEGRRDGYLLRVWAPEQTAVDLAEHASQAPATVQQRLHETGSTHLLPLAWLSELKATARFDLDGAGGVAARSDLGPGALAIRFEGADHGVPGLPNEVVRWPEKGQRADAPCYLMLPDADALDRVVHRGYVSLSRTRVGFEEDQNLLEIKVRKRRAIDVPATLNLLTGLPVVGRLHDFVGLDLLLSERDLDNAVVTRIWRYGPRGKPVAEKLDRATLSDALASGSLESANPG